MKHWEISIEDITCDYKNLLGRGEYGNVYLGSWLGTPVAIKNVEYALSEASKTLLERELNTMTYIHHPHVCQLLGYTRKPFNIVMEYFENGNLRDYMENNHFNTTKIIDFIIDILRGLVYLHSNRIGSIIHRDLKPDNLLITRSGKVKISDFGLSKMLKTTENMVVSNHKIGSKYYMSPEIENGEPYNEKTDIWSLGIIIMDFFQSCSIDNELKEIIGFMTNNNPQRRPSAKKLLSFFEAFKNKLVEKSKKTCCY